MGTRADAAHCCCLLFLDEDGRTRHERHACCPTHWREAERGATQ